MTEKYNGDEAILFLYKGLMNIAGRYDHVVIINEGIAV